MFMYVHNIDPVFLHLGPLEFRYYGFVYALGYLVMLWYLGKAASEGKIKNLTRQRAMDLVTYVMLMIVVGSRLVHILTRLPYYLTNPFEIIAVWHGGMAFFGGFLASILTALFLVRRWKVNFWELADVIVIPVPLFLGIGRIANFINGELPGRITSLPWAVQFPGYAGFRHPSQLYESALMLLLFCILFALKKAHEGKKATRTLPQGWYFWCFVAIYGLFRGFAELFKELDPFGVFGYGWMLYTCIAMFIVGSVQLARTRIPVEIHAEHVKRK